MSEKDRYDELAMEREEMASTVEPTEEIRRKIYEFINEATEDGLYPVVAYGLDPQGSPDQLLLVTSPISNMALVSHLLEKAGQKDYNLGSFVPLTWLQNFVKLNSVHVQGLQKSLPGFNAQQHMREVGRLAQQFGASHWSLKGFALVDICGFSTLSAEEQLCQRTSVSLALRQTSRRMYPFFRDGVLPGAPRFSRTSTGDGYYFWHRQPGGAGDMATFVLLLLVMTQAEAMRAEGDAQLRLRGAFTVGEAYTFPFRDFESPAPRLLEEYFFQDAVGPALNELARLLAEARPSQILVGAFKRPGRTEREEMMSPVQILTQAQREILPRELQPRETVTASDIELSFEPSQPLRVVDKHGDIHYCYNLVGKVPNRSKAGLRLQLVGLRQDTAEPLAQIQFRRDVTSI